MNRPNPSAFTTQASRREGAPSSADIAGAKPLFDQLRSELERLVRERRSFRSELRDAVAQGDRMIEGLGRA